MRQRTEPAPSKNRKGLRAVAGPSESLDELQARISLSSAYSSAVTARLFSQGGQHEDPEKNLDITACVQELVDKTQALDGGNTREIEHMLMGQAVACQAIFQEFSRRAALNMGTYLGPTETYMRLALRAQSQSRASLETLAEIKNPRPVYINPGQVNHTNGPQQVNNGSAPRAPENQNPPNKILENK